MIENVVDFTDEQKLEALKDRLGWKFESVRPVDWNPLKHVGHMGMLLRATIKADPETVGEYFYDCIDDSEIDILMMPYSDEGRSRLVDLCGSFMGCWYLPDDSFLKKTPKRSNIESRVCNLERCVEGLMFSMYGGDEKGPTDVEMFMTVLKREEPEAHAILNGGHVSVNSLALFIHSNELSKEGLDTVIEKRDNLSHVARYVTGKELRVVAA